MKLLKSLVLAIVIINIVIAMPLPIIVFFYTISILVMLSDIPKEMLKIVIHSTLLIYTLIILHFIFIGITSLHVDENNIQDLETLGKLIIMYFR